MSSILQDPTLSYNDFKLSLLKDYQLACESRETSLLGRKEVLTGKAKFGIFGDGKELPQIALAKVFNNGDWRAGYYRDQTLMMALDNLTIAQFFAQLYADTDVIAEPSSAGRQMNGHFATRSMDEKGNWKNLMQQKNSSSDISPTAAQMLRGLGLAFASKVFKKNTDLHLLDTLTNKGNEVCFTTIGDASTSEGYFWETLNAAAVMQVPLVASVWDDGFGISVPKNFQTSRESISDAASGFADDADGVGIDVYVVKAWDYAALIETYQTAVAKTRATHKPCLVHVEECTQPQGHSTSGSHERYKTKERLEWEREFDGLLQFKNWLLVNELASISELESIETNAKNKVNEEKKVAWQQYQNQIRFEREQVLYILEKYKLTSAFATEINALQHNISNALEHFHKNQIETLRSFFRITQNEIHHDKHEIKELYKQLQAKNENRYHSELTSENNPSSLEATGVSPAYNESSISVNGYELINQFFDIKLTEDPRIIAFGEDVGKIGDVNQGFMNLQEKHGAHRVMDMGIREATIMGQALGAAMRGLRPIAEIQYLDYLLYGLQLLSDDAATLRYRTKGGQIAPMIVRTRGHRLEGIWHTGSPMGMIVNALRGMHVCVPRNLTQAAGMYNLLLQSNDPALVIECLNGYRLKEMVPANLGTYTVALGKPDILQIGDDVTVITYGSCCRIAMQAVVLLSEKNISIEVIDVQTLLPFDLDKTCLQSIKKTNRVLFFDEDVEGGASAYMLQQVLEHQGAFAFLDAAPRTLTAAPHRTPFGSDGDYFSKPQVDDLFEAVYTLMHEAEPGYYKSLI